MGLALALMLAGPGPTAVGQPSLDAFCRAHVDRIEAQVLAAQAAVCPTTLINDLTNTMWAQLYSCMQNGQQHAREVEAANEAEIAKCQGPPRAPDHCDDYAQRSIAQIHRGLELGCNFSGQDWSTRDAPTLVAQCRAGARTGDIVNLRDQQLSNCERKPNEDKCEAFADSAILQSVKDREMQCGLAGRDRWATEGRSELVAWCRQASEGAARSYLEAREGDLGNCRYRGPDVCETFASTVEAQGARDVEMRCGLAGRPEWAMASRGELLSWCRAKPKAEVDGYVLMRERALDSCRNQGPDKCVAFAAEAQVQTDTALQMRCPFAGRPHWNITDAQGLRSWCKAAQAGVADRYLAQRDQDIRTCQMTGR
ncbi:MAG: hypothetical protein Q8L23_02655 [Caulobacter sp.]|nr:hypothetical protein [Caulobacter sp.]